VPSKFDLAPRQVREDKTPTLANDILRRQRQKSQETDINALYHCLIYWLFLHFSWKRTVTFIYRSAAIWCRNVVLQSQKHESFWCHLVALCCISTTETWNGVLLSGAVMLYYNPRSLNKFAAIWCRYVVLQRLKHGTECCYMVPGYCITTTENWASCDTNTALIVRFHFSQLFCR
jgi:hypothetical protein